MSVQEKIRQIRKTKGLTQKQVAAKLNMSPNGYGDIERGNNDPKLSKLEKIAEIFEIQLPELVDLTEKGTLNINFANQGQYNVYIGSAAAELERQLLINELQQKELALKDKELAIQAREIAYLKKLNELLKSKISHD